jgi:hypothetical protein
MALEVCGKENERLKIDFKNLGQFELSWPRFFIPSCDFSLIEIGWNFTDLLADFVKLANSSPVF